MEYLNGNIYHMVHFDNLESIFLRRALLSKKMMAQERNSYYSIAYDDVQELRDRVFVWDATRHKFKSLHSYVPFYIATHTPMLYVQLKRGLQDKIVIFEVARSIITERGTIFTNGNATNQQLAKYGSEVADVLPKTIEKRECGRRYRPNGPRGKIPIDSDSTITHYFLKSLIGISLTIGIFPATEGTRETCRGALPYSTIEQNTGIAVKNQAMVKEVNDLISQCNLTGRIPFATLKPHLFF